MNPAHEPSSRTWPAYLGLLESGELSRRAERLEALLAACRICPRGCGVDRTAGALGACRSDAEPVVASYCRHMGEEPPITGRRGSGTVFFAHCNLRCVYCQNHQISQSRADALDWARGVDRLAEMLLELQAQRCHNINFVSPTHYVPQMVRALELAARAGLRLPVVYNTNGYDALDVVRELDGIVDIYLPDLKYGAAEEALEFSHAPDYPEHARAAIAEMWRQVGPLELDEEGVARRGLLIRHLVLPNGLAESEASLRWLRKACGPWVTLGIMAQYYPAHEARRVPLLSRTITANEYRRVIECAQDLEFTNLLIQDHLLAPESYRPDFDSEHPFER